MLPSSDALLLESSSVPGMINRCWLAVILVQVLSLHGGPPVIDAQLCSVEGGIELQKCSAILLEALEVNDTNVHQTRYKYRVIGPRQKVAGVTEPTPDSYEDELPPCTPDTTCNGWTLHQFGLGRKSNNDPIAIGETVALRVVPDKSERLRIGICGRQCSVLTTWGATATELGHSTWVSASDTISSTVGERILSSYSGPSGFAIGREYVFFVQRNSETEMTVWANVSGSESRKVNIPLTRDRERITVLSFVGNVEFPEKGELESFSQQGTISSPILRGGRISEMFCVSIRHRNSTSANGGILLTARSEQGHLASLATVRNAQDDVGWKLSRLLVPRPEALSWRLVVSAGRGVVIESMGGCALDGGTYVQNGVVVGPYVVPDPPNLTWNATDSKVDSPCTNGGWLDRRNQCTCPPGFGGPKCDVGCGPDRSGATCGERCSESGDGCRRILFCTSMSACGCSAGLKGGGCNELCSPGEYGAGCRQRCGQCAGAAACDAFTGLCRSGCRPGYTGPRCHTELPRMLIGPNVRDIGDTAIKGKVVVSADHVIGVLEDSAAMFVEIQYREHMSGDWMRGFTTKAHVGSDLPFALDGLRPGVEYDVRAIILNERLEGFSLDTVPYVTVRTRNDREVSDVRAVVVNPWTLNVTWSSTRDAPFFSVMFTCERMLHCPRESCSASSGMVRVRDRFAVLTGLQPAATHRIRVSPGDQQRWETILVNTAFEQPRSSPDPVGWPMQITNTSAQLYWQSSGSCQDDNGPWVGYHWKLLRSDEKHQYSHFIQEGDTSQTSITFDNLVPRSNYSLQVYSVNTEGFNYRFPLFLNFTTKASAPSAPVELLAYRRSRVSVWLRWEAPRQPFGKLRSYEVRVVEASGQYKTAESVPAGSACPAWPGRVCLGLHGLTANHQYVVTVAAVNEFSDELGEEATVRVVTSGSDAASAPQNLTVLKRTADSAVVQWSLPDRLDSDLEYFALHLAETDRAADPHQLLHEDPAPPPQQPPRLEVGGEERAAYRYELESLRDAASYSLSVQLGALGERAMLNVTTRPRALALHPPLVQHLTAEGYATLSIRAADVKAAVASARGTVVGFLLVVMDLDSKQWSPPPPGDLTDQLFEAVNSKPYYVAKEWPMPDLPPEEVKLGNAGEQLPLNSRFRIALAAVCGYKDYYTVSLAATKELLISV